MSWSLVSQLVATATTNQGGTLSATFNVVNAGDLLVVGYSSYNSASSTFTVADTALNTWTLGAANFATNINGGFLWATANAHGSTTITLTGPSNSFLGFIVSEFSLASNATIALATTGTGSGSSTSASSGAMTFSGNGNFLVYGTMAEYTSGVSGTVGSGFSLINSFLYSAGHHIGQLDEYQAVTSSSSPLAVAATWSATTPWVTTGGVFVEMQVAAVGIQVALDRSNSRRRLLAD